MENAIMDSNMVTEFLVPINELDKNVLSNEAIEFLSLIHI